MNSSLKQSIWVLLVKNLHLSIFLMSRSSTDTIYAHTIKTSVSYLDIWKTVKPLFWGKTLCSHETWNHPFSTFLQFFEKLTFLTL